MRKALFSLLLLSACQSASLPNARNSVYLPQVVQALPAPDSTDVSPETSFTLTFSEPMNAESVEQNFRVRTQAGALNPLRVWDRQAFDISWNTQLTEVSFSFKAGQKLEWVKDTQPAGFTVSLDAVDGVIRDAGGDGSQEAPFRLPGRSPEDFYFFDVPYLP